MTKSGEIASTTGEVVSTLKEVQSTFQGLTGVGLWQGDSMEGLSEKVQKFVGDSLAVLQSKLDVLRQFAETYEKFEQLSQTTQGIRQGQRDQHCENSPKQENCHWTRTVDEFGVEHWSWHACGPFSSAVSSIDSNVVSMDSMHAAGQSIKGSFPSSGVPDGQGISPFSDYCSSGSCRPCSSNNSCGTGSCSGGSCGSGGYGGSCPGGSCGSGGSCSGGSCSTGSCPGGNC